MVRGFRLVATAAPQLEKHGLPVKTRAAARQDGPQSPLTVSQNQRWTLYEEGRSDGCGGSDCGQCSANLPYRRSRAPEPRCAVRDNASLACGGGGSRPRTSPRSKAHRGLPLFHPRPQTEPNLGQAGCLEAVAKGCTCAPAPAIYLAGRRPATTRFGLSVARPQFKPTGEHSTSTTGNWSALAMPNRNAMTPRTVRLRAQSRFSVLSPPFREFLR